MACNMPEPCKFPSLDSCQKRFLWTHKKVDLAQQPVVGLLLQAGSCEQVSSVTWILFFFSLIKQGSCFTATEEDGDDKRHVQLELACAADGIAVQDRA